MSIGDVVCHLHQFIDDLFVGEHAVEIGFYHLFQQNGELFRFYHIGLFVDPYLLCNQLLQKLDREVLFRHFGNLFHKSRVEEIKFLVGIREEINHTVALHTLL